MSRLLIILCFLTLAHNTNAAPQRNNYQKYLKHPSVERFREYIQIDTSNDENIKYAIEFWVRQAIEAGVPYQIYEPAGKPIFVATLHGSDPNLPAIMLNSHMDVVKVDERQWLHPPFAAYMDENGDIFGRGTQDTKDVGLQYMEAIRRIKKANVTLLRTFHLTVMPDEETGGYAGMKAFAKTKDFESLNIGFALDEGLPSKDNSLYASFVDRRPWQMRFTIYGVGGHGYAMPDESAMEQAYKFINAVMKYRDQQKTIMKTKAMMDYTGFNSININVINGGLMVNIIPSKMEIMVDMRLSPEADPVEIQALVESWMREAGNRTEVSFIRRETMSGVTSVDDSNPYWVVMRRTLNNMGIKIMPVILAATTDGMVLRNMGIPAIGFSAKTNTIIKIHTENEYINVETYLRGIDIYTELLKGLGGLPYSLSNIIDEHHSSHKC